MADLIDHFSHEFPHLHNQVNTGDLASAYSGSLALLARISATPQSSPGHYAMLFNVAGLLIDIGALQLNAEATELGLKLMTEHEEAMLKVVDPAGYYYNLSNGVSNQVFNSNDTASFHTIEKRVAQKNLIWKAIKYAQDHDERAPPEYLVNLANSLRQQFRFVEALGYYDDVNRLGVDIPQSWVNRSMALIVQNVVSGSYTISMLEQVTEGYRLAVASNETPPHLKAQYLAEVERYARVASEAREETGTAKDENDHAVTAAEYEQLSPFRKFCLEHNLTLSEHGLYCRCAGSARDNLTIPTSTGVVGTFVVPMEAVLNRLKSEFTFARGLYHEYVSQETPEDLQHEQCFSELFEDEILGIDIEKIRTAFRACFSILDKIGAAICELFDLYPGGDRNVYFQNMWRLDVGNRRERFEAIKNPGLLALYSIATDLNDKKNGEWAFYKALRNDLEHKFVVVHRGETPPEIYAKFKFVRDTVFIREADFVRDCANLLRLTRSAIFSFVFCVREHARKQPREEVRYTNIPIQRRNHRPIGSTD
jgi:hypothetical protein